MQDYEGKTVLVRDYGLFASWAPKLTEYFGRVLYFCPWKDAFPTSKKYMIGEGMDNVERVANFWDHVKDVDLFVFPDLYDGDLQVYLRDEGYRVWGSAKGEQLELLRWQTKQLMKKDLKLPVQPVERIIGIQALREFLMEHENQWVKISMLRGDLETFRHDHWPLTEPLLDDIENRLGANKDTKEFVVEEDISPAVETGYDGYTINGMFPEVGIHGYEVKDVAYIATTRPYDKIPDPVREVNDKFAPVFAYYNYRGFWSSEVRVTPDGTPYMIDACCRAGSPPNEIYQEMVSNWGDILWAGAEGEVVTPEPIKKYGVEVLIHCQWADSHWEAVYLPDNIRKWVKLRNLSQIKNIWHISPQAIGLPEIGAVVGLGDTMLEAIKNVRAYCKQIEGFDLELNLRHLETAVETIREGEAQGLAFSDDPLPEQSEIAAALSA